MPRAAAFAKATARQEPAIRWSQRYLVRSKLAQAAKTKWADGM